MSQTIDSRLMSIKVQKYLDLSQEQSRKASQRSGTGVRINSAIDDAAGLAIAERMNSEVRDMNAGIRNASDGISMTQTAEGGLRQVSDVLQRMRELAIQSANGTHSSGDRENLNAEFTSLDREIARIVETTTLNGEKVLVSEDAEPQESIDYYLGSIADEHSTLSMNMVEVSPVGATVSTIEASLAAIEAVDSMITRISSAQANVGALQSRFETAVENLQAGADVQSAARGRIMDADIAMEAATLVRSQMAQQSSTALLSQANVSSQSVVQLLG